MNLMGSQAQPLVIRDHLRPHLPIAAPGAEPEEARDSEETDQEVEVEPEVDQDCFVQPSLRDLVPPKAPALVFDSCFESGNLRAAVQVYDQEYDLFLSPDLNDRSSYLCQWYYFSVSNVVPGASYKFNLVNLKKKQSMYSMGKRPLVARAVGQDSTPHSPPRAQGKWYRAGTLICYHPSPYRSFGSGINSDGSSSSTAPNAHSSETTAAGATASGSKAVVLKAALSKKGSSKALGSSKKGASSSKSSGQEPSQGSASWPLPTSESGPGLYSCTFSLTFDQPGTYFVSSCFPYTYSDLQTHLSALETKLSSHSSSAAPIGPPMLLNPPLIMIRSLLCRTLSGQRCDLITVADFCAPSETLRSRECVVITARYLFVLLYCYPYCFPPPSDRP